MLTFPSGLMVIVFVFPYPVTITLYVALTVPEEIAKNTVATELGAKVT